jgi:hypothetical protein
MELALNEGQSVTDDLMSELSCKSRLNKIGTLRLEDLLVCLDTVYEECLAVPKIEISNQRRLGKLARPLAKEFRKPGNLKKLCGLAKKEDIVLTTISNTIRNRYGVAKEQCIR